MTKKPKLPPDDPDQSRRFIEAAREAETDDSPKAFERAFQRVMKAKPIARPSAPRSRRTGKLNSS